MIFPLHTHSATYKTDWYHDTVIFRVSDEKYAHLELYRTTLPLYFVYTTMTVLTVHQQLAHSQLLTRPRWWPWILYGTWGMCDWMRKVSTKLWTSNFTAWNSVQNWNITRSTCCVQCLYATMPTYSIWLLFLVFNGSIIFIEGYKLLLRIYPEWFKVKYLMLTVMHALLLKARVTDQ